MKRDIARMIFTNEHIEKIADSRFDDCMLTKKDYQKNVNDVCTVTVGKGVEIVWLDTLFGNLPDSDAHILEFS